MGFLGGDYFKFILFVVILVILIFWGDDFGFGGRKLNFKYMVFFMFVVLDIKGSKYVILFDFFF